MDTINPDKIPSWVNEVFSRPHSLLKSYEQLTAAGGGRIILFFFFKGVSTQVPVEVKMETPIEKSWSQESENKNTET